MQHLCRLHQRESRTIEQNLLNCESKVQSTLMCKNCVHTRMAKRKSNKKTNELYRTVSANSSWFVMFHSKTSSKWLSDPLRTRHMTYPSLPVDDFGYRPQIILRVVGSNISPFAFKRPVDSPTPRWNILRYLPAITRALTKNSKNFQAPLRQVRHHIVSDPLEYWHLTPVIWSRDVILLTYGIMTYSKPNSSPSFELKK